MHLIRISRKDMIRCEIILVLFTISYLSSSADLTNIRVIVTEEDGRTVAIKSLLHNEATYSIRHDARIGDSFADDNMFYWLDEDGDLYSMSLCPPYNVTSLLTGTEWSQIAGSSALNKVVMYSNTSKRMAIYSLKPLTHMATVQLQEDMLLLTIDEKYRSVLWVTADKHQVMQVSLSSIQTNNTLLPQVTFESDAIIYNMVYDSICNELYVCTSLGVLRIDLLTKNATLAYTSTHDIQETTADRASVDTDDVAEATLKDLLFMPESSEATTKSAVNFDATATRYVEKENYWSITATKDVENETDFILETAAETWTQTSVDTLNLEIKESNSTEKYQEICIIAVLNRFLMTYDTAEREYYVKDTNDEKSNITSFKTGTKTVSDINLIWYNFSKESLDPYDILVQTHSRIDIYKYISPGSMYLHFSLSHKSDGPFAYDAENDRIVVVENRSLGYITIKNNTFQPQCHIESGRVVDMAYDAINHVLYLADDMFHCITMVYLNMSTPFIRTTVDTGFMKPVTLVVSAKLGQLYWVSKGKDYKIMRNSLMGTDVITVYTTNDIILNIVMDDITQNLYWAESNAIYTWSPETENVTFLNALPPETDGCQTYAVKQNHVLLTCKILSGHKYFNFDLESYSLSVLKLSPEITEALHWKVVTSVQRPNYDRKELCSSCSAAHACSVSMTGKVECGCKGSYYLRVSNQPSCQAENRLLSPPGLVYTFGYRFCGISLFDAVFNKSEPSCRYKDYRVDFQALSFLYKAGSVWLAESKSWEKTIRMYPVKLNQLFWMIRGNANVTGVAMDWTTNNVYWTDRELNHIRVTTDIDKYMKTLVENLPEPRGIALHPALGLMFFTTGSGGFLNSGKVCQCFMDGSNCVDIVRENVTSPQAVALDISEDRLYWADAHKVESVLINGSDRTIIYHTSPSSKLYGVAIIKNFLAITESSSVGSKVVIVDKLSLEVVGAVKHHDVTQIYDVIGYAESNQPAFPDPCEKAGCDQVCLASPQGFSCACQDGMTLDSDGKSCRKKLSPGDSFLLFASYFKRTIYAITSDIQITALHTKPEIRPLGLAYDHVHKTVFYTSLYGQRVERIFVNAKTNITTDKFLPGRWDSMAYDHSSKLLYVCDPFRNRVGCTNGKSYKTLITGIAETRGIALHPSKGKMYVTSKDGIYRMNMDGTNDEIIVEDDIAYPTGITVDYKDNTLYWCDRFKRTIEKSSLSGKERKVIYELPSKAECFSIAVDDQNIYWVDWQIRGLGIASKTGQDPKRLEYVAGEFLLEGQGLVYYCTEVIENEISQCVFNNGGCSDFCLATPGGRHCDCPNGKTLAGDKATCIEMASTSPIPVAPSRPKIDNEDVDSNIDTYQPDIFSIEGVIDLPSFGSVTNIYDDLTLESFNWTAISNSTLQLQEYLSFDSKTIGFVVMALVLLAIATALVVILKQRRYLCIHRFQPKNQQVAPLRLGDDTSNLESSCNSSMFFAENSHYKVMTQEEAASLPSEPITREYKRQKDLKILLINSYSYDLGYESEADH